METKRHKTGFTLIELLVVVAIIALLLSILLPGLKTAKNYAKRVTCGSQLKQIGTALKMYADANSEYLPDDHDISGGRDRHTYAAYRSEAAYTYPGGKLKPLRYAYLYEQGYIEVPEVFYCPGNNALLTPQYVYDSYTRPTGWGTLPQTFNTEKASNQWVRIGYTYYPVERNAVLDAASNAPKELASKFIRLNTNLPCTTDIVHNRPSIAHQSNKVYALNAMYPDGHVSLCKDQDLFDKLTDHTGKNVWDMLDAGSGDVRYYDTAIYAVFRAIGP